MKVKLTCIAAALIFYLPVRATQPAKPFELSIFDRSLKWGDERWDAQAGLLRAQELNNHWVRESGWYAIGLLQRAAPGDVSKAITIFERLTESQCLDSTHESFGSFPNYIEASTPENNHCGNAPFGRNWRLFLGTTFALALFRLSSALPEEISSRLERAIQTAVEGEERDNRIVPGYTNIALLYSFLLDFAGTRFQREDWKARALSLSKKIYTGYFQNESFPEFNSPTYYGVDLFALRLWSLAGSTPWMQKAGTKMETSLWRSIARFYNASLKNMCGPFSRAYGMDLQQYVSLVGVWLAEYLGPTLAPLPEISASMEHGHDILWAPLFHLVKSRLPEEAEAEFRMFSGERQITQWVPGANKRIATAWIGNGQMWGGESNELAKPPAERIRPATFFWSASDNSVSWINLSRSGNMDATASKNGLEMKFVKSDAVFKVRTLKPESSVLTLTRWEFDGLYLNVDTDASTLSVARDSDQLEVRLAGVTRVQLTVTAPK